MFRFTEYGRQNPDVSETNELKDLFFQVFYLLFQVSETNELKAEKDLAKLERGVEYQKRMNWKVKNSKNTDWKPGQGNVSETNELKETRGDKTQQFLWNNRIRNEWIES